MRRAVILVAALAVATAVVSCSSNPAGTPSPPSGSGSSGSGSTGTTAGTTPGSTPPGSAPAGGLAHQYGVRYCEVLTVTVTDAATRAEVWGTQGLNDCPQAAFAAIDPAKVRADLGVTVALPNGPRYWVLDDIVANKLAGSGAIRDFGGVAMRSIATVDLGKGLPDRRPYARISVRRDTEFVFSAGRTVYELTAPDGAVYVMQSYSLEVDPGLTVDALAGLGARLALPPGWTYAARTLTAPLVVEDDDGIATVIQDELHNSYQQRTPARGDRPAAAPATTGA